MLGSLSTVSGEALGIAGNRMFYLRHTPIPTRTWLVFVFALFLRQTLTIQPWLAWKTLHKPK